MKLMKLLALCLATLALTACPQSKQGGDSIRTRDPRSTNITNGLGNVGPGGVNGNYGVNGRAVGQISLSYGMQGVQSFVSGFMDANQLGQIGSGYPNTGITFQGDVSGTGIMQAINGQGSAQIASTSSIGLLIYDSYVGQADSTGQSTPPISVFISSTKGGQAQGVIEAGGQAQVMFSDSYGSIILIGQVNAQTFQGEVQFQNVGGSAGSLGQFQVSTCGFFHCQ